MSPDITITKEYLESDDRLSRIMAKSIDPIELSMFMMEECPRLCKCGKGLYIYNGKHYDSMEVDDVKQLYHKFLCKYGITRLWGKRNDVIDSVFNWDRTTKVDKMNDYPSLLCFNNGILDLETRDLIPHSNEYYFDSCVDVDYDATATDCPVFIKFLKEVFNNNEALIQNAIMLGGYLIDTSTEAKKMFMFDGPAASGKSTLIDTYSMFFHHSMDDTNQVTSLSLDTIAGGGFKKEALINSRVNLCAEAKKDFLQAEEIKRIITGDFIEVDRKFKSPVTFRPKTKLVVACNGVPKFNDSSDGIPRRLQLFTFRNIYKQPEELKLIKNAEQRHIYPMDTKLAGKIKEEKSAILNLFLEGLKLLRSNDYTFIYTKDIDDAMNEFKRDSDTIREFLEDNYEVDMTATTPIKDVYGHYRSWYSANIQQGGSIKLRSAEMGKRIKEVFTIQSMGQKTFKVMIDGTEENQHLSVYPIRRIYVPEPTEEFGDLATAITVEEETLFTNNKTNETS